MHIVVGPCAKWHFIHARSPDPEFFFFFFYLCVQTRFLCRLHRRWTGTCSRMLCSRVLFQVMSPPCKFYLLSRAHWIGPKSRHERVNRPHYDSPGSPNPGFLQLTPCQHLHLPQTTKRITPNSQNKKERWSLLGLTGMNGEFICSRPPPQAPPNTRKKEGEGKMVKKVPNKYTPCTFPTFPPQMPNQPVFFDRRVQWNPPNPFSQIKKTTQSNHPTVESLYLSTPKKEKTLSIEKILLSHG